MNGFMHTETQGHDPKSNSLTFSKHYDVHIPPPASSFKSVITPKRIRRSRRISIEVHRITPAPLLRTKEEKDDSGSIKTVIQRKLGFRKEELTPLLQKHSAEHETQELYERAIVRVLVPKVVVIKAAVDITKGTVGAAVLVTKGSIDTAVDITKGSIYVTRKGATAIQSALKRSVNWKPKIEDKVSEDEVEEEKDGDTIDSSFGLIPFDHEEEEEESTTSSSATESNQFGRKWFTKYSFDVRDIHIVRREQNVCTASIQFQAMSPQERKIFFDSEEVAISFMNLLEDQQQKESRRIQLRLKGSMGDLKIPNLDQHLDLLIEVVGAERLSMNRYCNPFVTVMLDGKELHNTTVISNRCVSFCRFNEPSANVISPT